MQATFYGTIAWGLIRYSKRQGYRLWAIGWLIYTVGALQGGFASSATGLALQDWIALISMFIGASLILDGTRSNTLTPKRLRIYGLGIVLFTCIHVIGLVTGAGFQYVFTPLGFHVAFVCILASKTVLGFENIGDRSNWWFVIGLLLIATSWLVFPFTILLFDLFQFFIIFQAIGVIVTGSSMLTYFTRAVTKDLETQYHVRRGRKIGDEPRSRAATVKS